MSTLKKVPNYIVFFLMFLLTFTRTTIARIFPSLHHDPKPTVKVFALSEQTWASLRAGAEFQNIQSSSASDSDKKASEKQAEEKKADDGKSDPSQSQNKDQDKNKDNGKSSDSKEPAQNPDTQGPGGGDGDLGGIGG